MWSTELIFCFSSRRRHTRFDCDWSSDVCSSDLDLDLIVSNLDSGEVFVGNGIAKGFDLNRPSTNAVMERDFVNNVENVFLEPPLGSNYAIAVVGRRVSVNAVTANTQDVVQDYAPVGSSGGGEVTNAFVSLTRESDGFMGRPAL